MSPHAHTFEDEDLSAFLDGELDASATAALEARLAADPALQEELAALTEARAFMAEHGGLAAPPDLLQGILAAADAVEPESNVVSFWRRPLGVPMAGWAVAAAAILVVYVALPGARAPDASTAAAEQRPAAAQTSSMKKSRAYESAAPVTVPPVEAPEQVAVTEKAPLQQATPSTQTPPPLDRAQVAAKPAPMPLSTGVAKALKTKDVTLPTKAEAELAASKIAANEAASTKESDAKADAKTGEDNFAQVPYQYTVYTDDSAALMQLAAIAGRFQGELSGPNDRALELETLEGTEAATVVVKIPAYALQDFGRSIQTLGNVYQSSDNRVFAGDPVEVRVKVQLAAGKPAGNADAPPKASYKQMNIDAEAVQR